MGVTWGDHVEEVLASDLTAVLSCTTAAGGAVATPVSPIGLRDRAAGTVGFSTSLGFGRKLARIRRDPRVSLTYHAREHGFSRCPRLVLVQGLASVRSADPATVRRTIGSRSEPFLGPARTGRFWDAWLREYYTDRVIVDVAVTRILVWPDLDGAGRPAVIGAPLAAPPAPQPPPALGAGPRLGSVRAARRLRRLDHCLLAYLGADGYPVAVPVDAVCGDPGGIHLVSRGPALPPGGRRAGLVAHSYGPRLAGLAVQQHTGWLTAAGPDAALYAPHTQRRVRGPANATLRLLANGLLAKQGLRRARRAQRSGAAGPS